MSESLNSKPRRDLAEAYNRVIPKAWAQAKAPLRQPTEHEVELGLRRVWKRNFGDLKQFPRRVTFTAPVHTWVYREGDGRRRLSVALNRRSGWKEIIHDFSHWVAYRKGITKPHCDQHLEIERDAAETIVKRFFS